MLEENTRSDRLAEVGKVETLDQDAKDRGAKLLSVPNFLISCVLGLRSKVFFE